MSTIALLDPAELPALADLLVRCELPTAGIEAHTGTFLVAKEAGELVGSVGLEVYARAALLRSVAVTAPQRGQGLGRRLVDAALELAQQLGVDEIFLLTETAASYFARWGFVPVTRESITPAVTASVEFTSVCPVSAHAMRLGLERVEHI